MIEFDLTQRVAPFLDLHLVIPLLEFIQPRKIYDDDSLYRTHRSVMQKTNMIDSVIEMVSDEQSRNELLERRDEVLKEREQLKANCDPVVKILELDAVKKIMEEGRDREGNSKVLEYIMKNYHFKLEMLEYLFKYAKFQYDCGNYQAASICLYYYLSVVPQHDPNYLNALYGKLASEILNQDWTLAKYDLTKLKAYIDSDPFDTEVELLQHRSWLLHCSGELTESNEGRKEDPEIVEKCEEAIRHEKTVNLEAVIEMFMNQQAYLNSIQVLCPHLIRYLAVAVVMTKNKQKNYLKDLMKVIEVEQHNYRDAITDFLTSLYVDYDFDAAQQKLEDCEKVLQNDFFLVGSVEETHKSINLDTLASRFFKDPEEAETWVVSLIQDCRIDGAKIDSDKRQIVMYPKQTNIHGQLAANSERIYTRTLKLTTQLGELKANKKAAWKFELHH
uniref:Eukaryotic translation initiation factor 3 subunit E n=1 Tax=Ditylenchus dipsaci TaxID=166011 RepID=A0A915CP54_9BILA